MSFPIRAQAWNEGIGAQMTSSIDGSDFGGTVTVYITIDSGTQAIGTVGAGVCTNEGKGYYTYRPSSDETNGKLIGFTFTGPSAVSVTTQIVTIPTHA